MSNKFIFDEESKIVAKDKIKHDESISEEVKEYCYKIIDESDKFHDVIAETEDGKRISEKLIGYKLIEVVNSLKIYGEFLQEMNKEMITMVDMYCIDYQNLKFISFKDGREV